LTDMAILLNFILGLNIVWAVEYGIKAVPLS